MFSHCILRLGALGLVLTLAPAAQAEVSSWLFVGSGPALVGDDDALNLAPSLQLDLGLGTPPADDLIFGGLVRTRTHFGEGTDLHLLLRMASHDYVNGKWGWAVDAGMFQRTYAGSATGGALAISLGAPWGLGLTLDGALGMDGAQGYTLTFGVDLLRLTVYRRSGDNWLKNRFPAYRPEDEDERYRR